jgi:hypothetical protein
VLDRVVEQRSPVLKKGYFSKIEEIFTYKEDCRNGKKLNTLNVV